ncbi:hypothetical protein [Aminomonas paucivorans]|uniref:hypothetical protein n=1 Tax=Aminomonas paucivorans TaxID=81412 RepID=UPI003330C21F
MKGLRWRFPEAGGVVLLRERILRTLGSILPKVGHGVLALVVLGLLGLLGAWIFLGLPSRGDQALAVFPEPGDGVPWVLVQLEEKGLSRESLADLAGGLGRLGQEDRELDLPALLAGQVRRTALFLPFGQEGNPLGVFLPEKGELDSLRRGQVPAPWTGGGERPFRYEFDGALGAFRVLDAREDPAGFLALEGERVLFARSQEDLEAMKQVAAGAKKSLSLRWELEPRWRGHLLVCDGGWLDRASGEKDSPSRGAPLFLEMAWRYLLPAAVPGPGGPLGEAKWRVRGASFPWGEEKPESLTWNRQPFSLGDPPVLALGVNLPKMGEEDLRRFPGLDRLKGWLEELALPKETIGTLLRGPLVLSLGGKTQVLWFDLPGFLADFPGRGEAGQALADAVWQKLFLGTKPTALEGYDHGGATELPFTFLAAANRSDALLGLAKPEGIRPLSPEGPPFGGETVRGWGWIYADLPKLADTLGELTALDELFTGQELKNPFEEQAGDALRGFLRTLHPFLLVWDRPDGGTLKWYGR